MQLQFFSRKANLTSGNHRNELERKIEELILIRDNLQISDKSSVERVLNEIIPLYQEEK